ncbi:hypothetical protein D931_01543 [Enterococcus faecium 13.SD.W.09]|nr:hypothetical protein D931_01543 [Enterococcus faecium 13.SD.W.09]
MEIDSIVTEFFKLNLLLFSSPTRSEMNNRSFTLAGLFLKAAIS